MLENIKKVDKKILVMSGLILGTIMIIVVVLVVMSILSSGTISFEKLEEKVSIAAKNYYKDNDAQLPKKIGESESVDASTLVSGGYIKDLNEYVDEKVSCSAKVHVTKTYGGYDYATILDCGKAYKNEFLVDKLLSNVVTSGKGLYAMEDVVVKGDSLGIDEDGYDLASNELMKGYIYRGDDVDNFIKIADIVYRIVKIDGNKDFVLTTSLKQENVVFDDRYNSESGGNFGFNDYTVSRIYESLQNMYDIKKSDSKIKLKGISKNICIGSRSLNERSTDGSVECRKVLKNQFYSLIPVFDIMNASLSTKCNTLADKDCTNYNYLMTSSGYWTLTADSANSYSAYKVENGIVSVNTKSSKPMKHVFYVTNKLVYVSGTGTEADPYIVK